jgi:hypothetical protein
MFLKPKLVGLIFAALVLNCNQSRAACEAFEFPVKAQIDMNTANPTLKILNSEKSKLDDGYKVAIAPLVVMVNNQGNFVKIVDPEGFAFEEVQNNAESNSFATMLLHESNWSTENAARWMDDGAMHILKGLGKLGVGTIIVACILSCRAGKFLAVQTYNGTSRICKDIWTKTSEFYERKKLEHDLANLSDH